MAETDALDICNEALLLMGEAPIDAFEGAQAANVACARLYPSAKKTLLASHPWNFNRFTRDLTRLAAAPSAATGFSAAYQMPGEVLRIVRVFVNAIPVTEWSQEGESILVDAASTDTVALEFHALVDEQLFSPQFRRALVMAMVEDLAPALAQSEGLTDRFQRGALRAAATARHSNATQRPTQHIPAQRLTRLRSR